MRDLGERKLDAETRCSQWLADGNYAKERGKKKQAERYYEKSQFWLDRLHAIEAKIASAERCPNPLKGEICDVCGGSYVCLESWRPKAKKVA